LFVNRVLTANPAGTCAGALDSPEFTRFNDALIIGIRCWEGTELDMGMARILLCWPEDAIFSAAKCGLTQFGHGLVALSPSPHIGNSFPPLIPIQLLRSFFKYSI
jgi:hypothetical protein